MLDRRLEPQFQERHVQLAMIGLGRMGANMVRRLQKRGHAIERQGVDVAEVAARLQKKGGEAFATSWRALLSGLADKTAQLAAAGVAS